MALSNAERQQRYRLKTKNTDQRRLEAVLPFEVAIKLKYLAEHWQFSDQVRARVRVRCEVR